MAHPEKGGEPVLTPALHLRVPRLRGAGSLLRRYWTRNLKLPNKTLGLSPGAW